jgi:hypothetical protein
MYDYGNDHSPTRPYMNSRDYLGVHGRQPSYRRQAVEGEQDGALWRELNYITDLYGWRFSEPEKEKIIADARRVRGPVHVKLAVSLYAHNVYSGDTIIRYLKSKGIDATIFSLYHLCYASSLVKAKDDQHVPFEEVLPDDLFDIKIFNELKSEYNAELERALSDPQFAGKRSRTIAKQVIQSVLKRRGLA